MDVEEAARNSPRDAFSDSAGASATVEDALGRACSVYEQSRVTSSISFMIGMMGFDDTIEHICQL